MPCLTRRCTANVGSSKSVPHRIHSESSACRSKGSCNAARKSLNCKWESRHSKNSVVTPECKVDCNVLQSRGHGASNGGLRSSDILRICIAVCLIGRHRCCDVILPGPGLHQQCIASVMCLCKYTAMGWDVCKKVLWALRKWIIIWAVPENAAPHTWHRRVHSALVAAAAKYSAMEPNCRARQNPGCKGRVSCERVALARGFLGLHLHSLLLPWRARRGPNQDGLCHPGLTNVSSGQVNRGQRRGEEKWDHKDREEPRNEHRGRTGSPPTPPPNPPHQEIKRGLSEVSLTQEGTQAQWP